MDRLNLVIFGPQGCGKGTQANILSKKYNIPHISTGDIFRDHMARKTELGLKIQKGMDEGKLVSDDITNEIVTERLKDDDCNFGFILDGYPRTLEQAKFFLEKEEIDYCIDIKLEDDVAIERMMKRAETEHRSDDTPEGIKTRLNTYHKATEPILELFYEKDVAILDVDGDQSIEEVTDTIISLIQKPA